MFCMKLSVLFWCRMCELEFKVFWWISSLREHKHVSKAVTYFRVGVPTDDDVNRAWRALTQDRVDVIKSHVVNHGVVDLHDLVPIAEGMKRMFKKHRADKVNIGGCCCSALLYGCKTLNGWNPV